MFLWWVQNWSLNDKKKISVGHHYVDQHAELLQCHYGKLKHKKVFQFPKKIDRKMIEVTAWSVFCDAVESPWLSRSIYRKAWLSYNRYICSDSVSLINIYGSLWSLWRIMPGHCTHWRKGELLVLCTLILYLVRLTVFFHLYNSLCHREIQNWD